MYVNLPRYRPSLSKLTITAFKKIEYKVRRLILKQICFINEFPLVLLHNSSFRFKLPASKVRTLNEA